MMHKNTVLNGHVFFYFTEELDDTANIFLDQIGSTLFKRVEDEDYGDSESIGYSLGLSISLMRLQAKHKVYKYQYGLSLSPSCSLAGWDEMFSIDNYLLSLLRSKGFPLLSEDDQRVKDTALEGEVYFWDARSISELTKMMNALFTSKFKMISDTKSEAYMLGLNVTLQDTGEEKNEQKKYLFSTKDHRMSELNNPDILDITDYIKNIFTAESVALAIED